MKRTPLGSFIRLYEFFKKQKNKIVICTILIFVFAVLDAIGPWVLGLLTTEFAENAKDIKNGVFGAAFNLNFAFIIVVSIVVRGLTVNVIEVFINRIMVDIVQRSMYDLRNRINAKFNKLPISYFDKRQIGEVYSRLTNDVDAVGGALQQGLVPLITAFLSIVGTVIMLTIISPLLALVSLILIPGTIFITRFIVKKSQKHFDVLQNHLGDMNGFVQERLSGFETVKLYGIEQKNIEEFDEINKGLTDSAFSAVFLSNIIRPIIENLTNICYVLVIIFGGLLTINGQMTLGNFQAFSVYIWIVAGPIGQITQLAGSIQIAASSIGRIFELLDAREETPDGEPYPFELKNVKGKVTFKGVKFGYNKKTPLMNDINFEVEPGQTIAIVGHTGAGKTTLVNLLMRFYDVTAGEILVDDIPIKDMSRHQLRSMFGMVLQDPWLFHGTIIENIRFGDENISDEKVTECAKTANAHKFANALHDGYDSMIDKETSNLSTGQKQLITIARALVVEPKIVILDEATSSVDTRLEKMLQKAMKEAIKGRTSFIIAHRLSTVRDADMILVMKNGDIVESGTHEELLANSGIYGELYQSQFS